MLWISNEDEADAGALVAASRRVHDTHWVAFLADDESPGSGRPWDSGEFVPADTREVGRFDPFDVLHGKWDRCVPLDEDERQEMADAMAPCGFTFPGLAPPGAVSVAAVAPSGFKRLFSHPAAPSSPWSEVEARRNKRIGVVAAQRPADIITVIGWQGAVNVDGDPASMSAVLRSWEDRFGAMLVEIGFDTLVLVVERPPRTPDHAVAVAAEHYAFCYDNIMQGVGSIRSYASLLVGRHLWEFWWD